MLYFKLAWRYATCRFVNYIAVAAVMLSLAVQIVAMSVLDGMLVDLEQRLRNLGEQITLDFQNNPPADIDLDLLRKKINATVPEISAVTPLFQNVGLLQAAGRAEYAWVYGIDLEKELKYSSLASHLRSFRPDREKPKWFPKHLPEGNYPGVFIGEPLADSLGINPGDAIELIYADRDSKGAMQSRSLRLTVTSLFRTGSYQKDRGIYMPIAEANRFYLGSRYNEAEKILPSLVFWLDDPNQANDLEAATVTAVNKALGRNNPNDRSNTWQKRWYEIAAGMKHENNLMELVLILNNIASGFCVFAIMATLVSRRMRDVGLLRCVGASRRAVMTIFLLVGLFIGAAGSLLGVGLGTFLVGKLQFQEINSVKMLASGGAARETKSFVSDPAGLRPRLDRYYEAITGMPLYPPRMFGVEDPAGLPIVIYPWKLFIYVLSALGVAVLAAVYPALLAAWREPMSALREE